VTNKANDIEVPVVLDPKFPQFPSPELALVEPDGLLALGGNLSPDTLVHAYRCGIFPWYEQHQPILWWSPGQRAVIYPDQIHLSRSLCKTLRRGNYEITTDQAFSEVIDRCSTRSDSGETSWITNEMIAAYTRLFDLGIAHSIECWMDGELAGGLYGVQTGQIFCGESMFSRRRDGSKIALAHLANTMKKRGFGLIDCQIGNPHLYSLGAVLIDRTVFLEILERGAGSKISWPADYISAKLFAYPTGQQ
jgi:leucyl/phenylalanyl-tRNA--protein transferase